MKKKIVVSCLFLMILSSIFAVPYASMGNINIPDAYILPHKMIDLGYTNYFVSDIGYGASDVVEDMEGYDFAVTSRFGLYNRAELGLIYTSYEKLYANVKIRLINESETVPALSVGAVNLFSGVSEDDLEEGVDFPDGRELLSNSPFIAVSKSIVIVTGLNGMNYLETTFHGGIGGRKFQGQGDITKNLSGMFLGFDVRPSKYFSLDLEMDSQNINLGINAYIQNFVLRAGIYEIESIMGVNERDTRIALNLGYTFDQFSDVKAAEKRKPMDIAPSGRTYQPESGARESYQQSDPMENPLMNELEEIRKRREQAEKELEEIRKLLRD